MVARMIIATSLAFTLTIASAFVPVSTDKRALYGHDGPLGQNWLPRELGGWPAPYLADNPNTSVPHKLGPEDVIRPGSFVATPSFWLLVSLALSWLLRAALRWSSQCHSL
jgi:hypothetical protein